MKLNEKDEKDLLEPVLYSFKMENGAIKKENYQDMNILFIITVVKKKK